jgi:hypothetical protein
LGLVVCPDDSILDIFGQLTSARVLVRFWQVSQKTFWITHQNNDFSRILMGSGGKGKQAAPNLNECYPSQNS